MEKRKYLGAACILLGISIIAAPFIKEAYEDHRQQEILKLWKQEMQQIEEAGETAGTETLREPGTTEDTAETNAEQSDAELVGVLKIPSIELEQPILKGATEQNLNLSVATVEPTGSPGEDGNFAIAGHNSRTYGRHFNRLVELAPGDELIVDTGEESYTYVVADIYIVEAEDVWVLGDTIAGGEITLITCYYPEQGDTQRLIVKGKLLAEE